MSDLENQYRNRYSSASVSVIGEGTVYRGDIEFEGVLHVNGDFYGNINGNGDLGIGLTGRVRSVIRASNVIISGLVFGNIFALGRVAIKSSAIVVGNIHAITLVVEEGSILHGKLEIMAHEQHSKIAKPGLFSYRKAENSNGSIEEKPAEIKEEEATDVFPDDDLSKKDHHSSRKGKYSVWN